MAFSSAEGISTTVDPPPRHPRSSSCASMPMSIAECRPAVGGQLRERAWGRAPDECIQRASEAEDETCWASAGSCSSTSMKVNLYLGQEGFQASTRRAVRVARHGHLMTSTPLQLQAVGCSSRAIAVSHLPPSNLGEASQEQSRIPAFPRPVTKLEKKSRNCCGMRCSAANQ